MKKVTLAIITIGFAFMLSTSAFAEKQPMMKEALEHLQKAEKYLSRASHDKAGHLKKALKQTRAAIQHVKKGARFDNRHTEKKHYNQH